MFTIAELERAADLVHATMPATPEYAWPLLARRCGCEVWVKHENHSPTGAFKIRGGLTYMEALAHGEPVPPGVVTATRGNHGQSIARAGRAYDIPVTIVVPHGNSVEKNRAMRAFGADLIEHGNDFDDARDHALTLAREHSLYMLPSYDPLLVRGVATYALELFRAVAELDVVYVPIGLGSGICGLIRTRDLLNLRTRIVGVVARNAPAYALSFDAGAIRTTESADTVADGMACRVPDPDAFEMIREGADRIVDLSEDEIIAAIRAYWEDTHNLAEGAGAAPLAALLKERDQMSGKRVGLILCGGNIDLALFLALMGRGSSAPQSDSL